jgi:hypothetical protein
MESVSVSPVTVKDAAVKTFVKAEKVNFTAKHDPAPRIISPRDPRYNYALGLFIKPIEGTLYPILNRMCGGTTVMKGLNALEVGGAIEQAWNEFSQPVAIGLDAKRFDQHTREAQLRFEQFIYLMFFEGGEKGELRRLLRMQLKAKCSAWTPEGVVKFFMQIRCSGDMNTGLGTCLIACCLVYCYCELMNLRFRLIDNGDDGVVILESCDLDKFDDFHDYCKELGYFMEMEEPVYQLEHISFCQSKPVLTVKGYVMVRQFPELIDKDCVSLLPLKDESSWRKWANDIGNCGSALCDGVPVLHAFYRSLRRAGVGSFGSHPWTSRTGMARLSERMTSVDSDITDAVRVSFWEAFGVDPDMQCRLEALYDATTHEFTPGPQGYRIDILNDKHSDRIHTKLDTNIETYRNA